ncbi:MAG: glycosyltransferase family 4 protein [Parvularculaceae bacterium]
MNAFTSDAPLRVLISSYRSHPHCGGQGVYIRHLTKALADLGHHVDVASGPPYPELDSRVRLIELPSLDLYSKKNALLALRAKHLTSWSDLNEWWAHNTAKFGEPKAFGRRFARYVRRLGHGYDVIHDNQTLAWGVLKARACGAPLVATLHHPITIDRDLAISAAPDALHRMLIRRWHSFLPMQIAVARRIDHLITVSNTSRAAFTREFGLDDRKFTTIPLGFDQEIYYPPSDGSRRDPNLLVTTASADTPLKGLRHLVEAMARLKPSRPALRLVVIGALRKGPAKDLIEAHGLGGVITFRSGVPDSEIGALYRRAALAVVPSLYEGFGLPALEAMACGAAIVATSGGALPEVIGDAGAIAPPGDSTALAREIAALLDAPERRRALGAAAAARARVEFSWARCADATARVYRKAISIQHADCHTEQITPVPRRSAA